MTAEDWTRLSVLLRSWWPGEFDAERDEAYRLALGAFEPSQVLDALEHRLRAGETFRPSAAQLVADISGRSQSVGAHDAWSLIEQAVRRIDCSIYDERFAERHQAAVDWLASADRVVAAWAASRGLCGAGSLGAEPIHDPQIGGAVLGRLQREYGDQVAAAAERERLGRPAVPDSMLLVRDTSRGAGGMDELVERLRPAPALPTGRDSE